MTSVAMFLDSVSCSDEETRLRLFSRGLIPRANVPLCFLLRSFTEGGMFLAM